MIALYLYLNALLYVMFGVWQTLSPWKTAMAIGYETLNSSGRSEYLVIYGGLQLGMAAFFGLSGASPELHRPALLFSLCLYSGIAVYRVVTVMKFWPVKGLTLGVGALEVALFIGALLLYLQRDSLGS